MPEDDASDADCQNGAKAVLCRRSDAQTPQHEKGVKGHQRETPDEPPFLGKDGEREVAVLLVQEHELILRPFHETLPNPTPVAYGDSSLMWIPIVSENILVWIEPSVDALVLIAAQTVAPEHRCDYHAADAEPAQAPRLSSH